MKTIKEVLLQLPADVFKKAVTNIINNGGDLSERTMMTAAGILTCEFSWHSSPEGSEYWKNIVDTFNPQTAIKD